MTITYIEQESQSKKAITVIINMRTLINAYKPALFVFYIWFYHINAPCII